MNCWASGDEHVLAFLATASSGEFPRDVRAFGLDFVVYRDVFSPLLGCLPVHEALGPWVGRDLLDIGCGAGTLAVLAAKAGARRIVATDINPLAVANASANVVRHAVADRVEIRQGDLFDPIGREEKFDTVFWNAPFHFVDAEAELTMLQRAAFDPGYRAIRSYVREAHRYLKLGGRLFLQFSAAYGRQHLIQEFAHQAGVRLQVRERWPAGAGTMIPIELLELVSHEAAA
jgi:release factor glutamine methyltransferase